ncbi:MAG: aspartate kinase [Deltaproteobacteria bacterium]|nr:aspartate kinase [Deltaproteobacteria bacterium]
MALVVQKYGGTSVGTIEKIQNVARRVARTYDEDNDMVVVVSAMAGETNRLVALSEEMCEFPSEREYDVLVAAGEQVSIALLSMALQSMGYMAKSYLGWQVPIYTDDSCTKARIKEIQDVNIREDLHNGTIVIVAGFQGLDRDNNITTFGRGGSDTSAVAVAAALKADVCEILTDVDGVYTTDPRIVPEATKIDKISYDEMLEMASLGAKVLQIRSVELAKKYDVVIHVRSSLNDNPGTLVMKEDADMETVLVSGVAYNKDEAKITVMRVPDQPGIAAQLFSPLSDADITVDMIIQNVSYEGHTNMTFTVPRSDFKKALKIVEEIADKIGADGVQTNESIAKVSIIGVGMRSHAGIASKMFETLSAEGVNIQMISTSEIKVSCVIDDKYTELAVRVLHEAFGLDNGQVVQE